MAIGITPRDLAKYTNSIVVCGAVPFIYTQTTVAATASYSLFNANGAPFSLRIINFYGFMTGAGAAGDTIQLQDGSGNAITEAVDVDALSANDYWACSSINRTNYTINPGEGLTIVTASGALSECFVTCMKV